ncbi:hypothetical protein OESDEN_08751 [Oesophagostomum dentatum]|uniref:DUF7778 domain-containing protein n=1 Tax=Oesophagostomum dentatum TaxID=61180 RepID=A0A0B1T2A8_OESDE|nr:hypothetical protein OESDEN_08751 [Oesophagostomum dentatum]
MQPKGRTSRSEVFYISRSFKKAVSLPPARAWRVKDSDVVARGYVLCVTKSKGLLFDKMSNLEPRLITLTRTGLLIVYNREDKGYVVDVKDARIMTTKTDHFRTRRQSYRRCMLKLKFMGGSISMILFNEEIPSWRDAIVTAHDGMTRGRLRFTGTPRIKMTAQKLEDAQTKANMLETAPEEEGVSTSKSPTVQGSKASVTTCIAPEDINVEPMQTNSEVTVDMPDTEPITIIELPVKNEKPPRVAVSSVESSQWETFDPSLCDSSYQWLHRETRRSPQKARKCASESTNSGLFTDSDEDETKTESAKSIRCGYHSVSTLRSRLEAKMRGMSSRKPKNCPKWTPANCPKWTRPTLSGPKIREAPPKALPLKIPPKPKPAIKFTPPSPLERSKRAGKSQSETECTSRRELEKPSVTSYDDSLLDVPHPDHGTSSKQQSQRSRNTNTSLEKYNPNQWWAQSLRV